VHAISQRLLDSRTQKNADGPLDQFPGVTVTGEKLSEWHRIIAAHHTCTQFTKAWSGDAWLAGSAAIEAILDDQQGPTPLRELSRILLPEGVLDY